jgi:hypothetical protein
VTFHFAPPPKTVVKVADDSTVVITPEEGSVTVSVPEEPIKISVSEKEPVNVSVVTGLPGPVGPPGPSGGSYVFVQGAPTETWTIDHSLGYYPNITIVDSSGAVIEGDIIYADDDTLVVTFSAAFSGKAFLS